jgi:hypothetical protein
VHWTLPSDSRRRMDRSWRAHAPCSRPLSRKPRASSWGWKDSVFRSIGSANRRGVDLPEPPPNTAGTVRFDDALPAPLCSMPMPLDVFARNPARSIPNRVSFLKTPRPNIDPGPAYQHSRPKRRLWAIDRQWKRLVGRAGTGDTADTHCDNPTDTLSVDTA